MVSRTTDGGDFHDEAEGQQTLALWATRASSRTAYSTSFTRGRIRALRTPDIPSQMHQAVRR